jgi:hypothetical protein
MCVFSQRVWSAAERTLQLITKLFRASYLTNTSNFLDRQANFVCYNARRSMANSVGDLQVNLFRMLSWSSHAFLVEFINREVMESYPVCSSGNYVLCDGARSIFDVELTPEGAAEIAPNGEGFLAHSNHFLCAPHACRENDAASLPDSFPRLDRIRSLIGKQSGSLTVESMKSILADHDGHPVSICRHPHTGPGNDMLPNTGRTVAAIIAEPNRGRIHISSGNPCEVPFVEYSLSRTA